MVHYVLACVREHIRRESSSQRDIAGPTADGIDVLRGNWRAQFPFASTRGRTRASTSTSTRYRELSSAIRAISGF